MVRGRHRRGLRRRVLGLGRPLGSDTTPVFDAVKPLQYLVQWRVADAGRAGALDRAQAGRGDLRGGRGGRRVGPDGQQAGASTCCSPASSRAPAPSWSSPSACTARWGLPVALLAGAGAAVGRGAPRPASSTTRAASSGSTCSAPWPWSRCRLRHRHRGLGLLAARACPAPGRRARVVRRRDDERGRRRRSSGARGSAGRTGAPSRPALRRPRLPTSRPARSCWCRAPRARARARSRGPSPGSCRTPCRAWARPALHRRARDEVARTPAGRLGQRGRPRLPGPREPAGHAARRGRGRLRPREPRLGSRERCSRRVPEALAQVGLAGFERRTPTGRSRAASSSAWPSPTCSRRCPGLLVFDEPTANLDPPGMARRSSSGWASSPRGAARRSW